MAGYVIHLAVGEEYLRKHPNEIKDYSSFIDGIIAPDGVKDKSKTHYGEKSSKVNLKKYFEERDINSDFDKGYFLHLVTDYLFYNKFLDIFDKDIVHRDYDYTNKDIEKIFNVKIPAKVKSKVFYLEGQPTILNLEETITFIKNTAKYDLLDIKNEVLKENSDWLTIKVLKKYK